MATFTDLPAEVRNSIYRELLGGVATAAGQREGTLGLLTASRLIHEEAASYFYQHKTFTISFPVAMSDRRTTAFSTPLQGATVIPPIPDKHLRYLRQLTIDVRLDACSHIQHAQRISSLCKSDARLSLLTLNLTSKASKILSNSVDDYVLHSRHPLTLALQHLLTSNTAQLVRIQLNNVWFGPGTATQLQSEFGDRLELHTAAASLERCLLGQTTQSHLYSLALDDRDIEDATYIALSTTESDGLLSLPSSLSTALSELDRFSPMEFLDDDAVDLDDLWKAETAESVFDEAFFGTMDGFDARSEDLNADDDVDDDDMEGIDDFDAVMGHVEEVMHFRANQMDVEHMVNFAPGLLGRWVEESS